MFGLFKTDPVKKLRKQYHFTVVQAILAQQQGHQRKYCTLSAESEALRAQLNQAGDVMPVLAARKNCARLADEDAEF